jgi:hypothetical protein
MKSYDKYIDFIFLDAPFACANRPIPSLIKMGFKGCKVIENGSKPSHSTIEKSFLFNAGKEVKIEKIKEGIDQRYFCWLDWTNKTWNQFKDKDGKKGVRYGKTRLDETVFGNEESIGYIIDYMNSQDFSFDGFLCFSQGALIV